MENTNINRILEKYGYASITIVGGWSSRYSRSSFGQANPQMGREVSVKVGSKEVYYFDNLGDRTVERNDTGLALSGTDIYYELAHSYQKFLNRYDDWNYGVMFYSGTVTIEKKEESK
ncbi:MAG: hypothetical protein WCS18_12550 [Sphaerochaetaceae bacterium]